MKSVPFSKLLAVSAVLFFAITGCQPRRPHITPIPGQRSPAPGDGNTGPMKSGDGVPADPNVGRVPLNPGDNPQTGRPDNFNEDRETFKEQTILFDYDSATVKPGEKFKIDAVAAYLKSNPTLHVRVEGHCDERGTEEYNRSLGERRALSAREVLIASGVPADHVSTISYGEDKPAVAGHDEAAWTKNRRAEFVLLKPKS